MGAFRLDIFSKTRPFIKNRAVNLQNKLIQMPQRYFFGVVVFIFLFCGEILGQEKNVEKIPVALDNYSNYTGFSESMSHRSFIKNNALNGQKRALNPIPFSLFTSAFCPVLTTQVTQDFYSQHLSFFCRKELQIEKATTIPLRFRLGSLAYTNYLEQKPNSGFRP